MPKYMVEHEFTYGWDDAGWMIDDKPQRFDTAAEAEADLDDFIDTIREEYECGNMSEPEYRCHYRVVEVSKSAS